MGKIKILFMSANPAGTQQLNLAEQAREIEAKIRAADHSDSLELVTKWAVRPDDLLQALNQHKPHIVHFSGHGSPTEEIVLLDKLGKPKPVSKEALVSLFRTLKDNIRVVVLNACFSRPQAEAITGEIDCAVGMMRAIGDDAAITFAASFYRAIGFGRSIKDAFDQGITALLLDGSLEGKTPVLMRGKDTAPEKVFLITPSIGASPNKGSQAAGLQAQTARNGDETAGSQASTTSPQGVKPPQSPRVGGTSKSVLVNGDADDEQRPSTLRVVGALGATIVAVLIWVLWDWPWVKYHTVWPWIKNYKVLVRYSGVDNGNVQILKGFLLGRDFIVTDYANRAEAQGRNDVRYGDSKSLVTMIVAGVLADQVNEGAYGSEALVARPESSVPAGTLELWVSRPPPVMAPPPMSPPTAAAPVKPNTLPIAVNLATWATQRPTEAYCMQRKNSDAGPGKFLVLCFKTEDLCRRAQLTDSGDRTPCVASTNLNTLQLWQKADRGAIGDSWFRYASQQFPPPFPQFDTLGPEPARYRVSIWFAGFNREKDIVPLSLKLREMGWDAQIPRPPGGGDRTLKAIGTHEVRYHGLEDRLAADMLATSVKGLVVVPKPVVRRDEPSSDVTQGELQLWISN